jgi:hypothetical protein
MQRAGLNIQIPSSSLFCSQRRNKYDAVGKRGGRRMCNSSSSPSSDPFAFLKQKIEEIRISDEQYLSRYGIDIKGSFEKLKRTYKKFSEYYSFEYEVDYTGCETTADRILKLAESFDAQVESTGFYMSLSKDYDATALNFVLYYPLSELDWTICIFYCSPADYLSEEGSLIYKKFIKYISCCMGISIGVEDNVENYFLEAIINWYDEGIYSSDDEPDEGKLHIAKMYQRGGRFQKLFQEISNLPRMNEFDINKELENYREKCPHEELELVECMIDGVSIIKKMNVCQYDFTPDVDTENDDYCDGKVMIPWTTAILYSSHDGLSDDLVDCINTDVQSGLEAVSWMANLILTDETTPTELKEFEANKDLGEKFEKWINGFNKLTEKFDRYEQPQRKVE